MRWAEHVARIITTGLQDLHNISKESLQGSRPLGRPKCLWKYNNQTELKELGHEGVD